VTYRREVFCPGCGRPREISDRHARRTEEPTLCVACRHPGKHLPPGDSDRRFWLERFSDEEIVLMVEAMTDRKADLDRIRWWRKELNPKGMK
jgi:hypothetical protein